MILNWCFGHPWVTFFIIIFSILTIGSIIEDIRAFIKDKLNNKEKENK